MQNSPLESSLSIQALSQSAKDCSMKQPAVYIMASQRNGTLYTGVTANLFQQIWQHREDVVEGFTRRYGVKMLVWYEQHESMSGAIAREKAIRKWNRAWKLRLIEERNPHWQDLWPEIIGASPISTGSPPARG
jgi:putative endonuclease